MNFEIQPFECPICFERYDREKYVPAMLHCGHSCCISHILVLSICPICRKTIDPETVNPSFALRDGAIMYYHLFDAIEMREPENEEIISVQKIIQVSSDEQYSRRLQNDFNTEKQKLRPPSPRTLTRNLYMAQQRDEEQHRYEVQRAEIQQTVISRESEVQETDESRMRSIGGTVKRCSHWCCLMLNACCACLDTRSQGSQYPVFVDGIGLQSHGGSRRDNYCPICKTAQIDDTICNYSELWNTNTSTTCDCPSNKIK